MTRNMLLSIAAVLMISSPAYCARDNTEGAAPGIEHVVVHRDDGRFCGWPANNGAWSWGNEILVAFDLHFFKEPDRSVDPTEHHVDWDKPAQLVTARSLDGGQTWKLETPGAFVRSAEPKPRPEKINFARPDFALRAGGSRFHISYDRGKNWQGPYEFGNFGVVLGSRTDYIVKDKDNCMLFLSARGAPVCLRTTDAGNNFELVSRMMPPLGVAPGARSIMPATVRVSENELVTAVRQLRGEEYVSWIDTYVSKDNGKTWYYLSRVAEADKKYWNGNPPAIARLCDGRLAVTYGYRAYPYGIRAKLSTDNGQTWGREIILRRDGRNWDLGYTRTVVRTDGKIVTMYYYSTKDNPNQYIAATIWDPDRIDERTADRVTLNRIGAHIDRIAESMNRIQKLSQGQVRSVNDLVWWMQEKENSADALTAKLTENFLSTEMQGADDIERLKLIQSIIHHATETKESKDIANIMKLKALLTQLRTRLFETDDSSH